MKFKAPFLREQEIIGVLGNKHHIPSAKRVWEKFFERRNLLIGIGMIGEDEKDEK